ncbi:50S ribosomal protein L32 [Enterococcus faecalis]|uniref:50S ribosomal protein L32 n=1 Tax=Enterococcus faecalis TaxID=1351 RepID=UPI003CC68187
MHASLQGGGTTKPVPARRTSKEKKAKRRTHYNLTIKGLNACSNCGEMKKTHHVCPECGHYDGKDVMSKEA